MSDKDNERAKQQAKSQLESVIAMVNRLEHCQECDGEDCTLTDEGICEGLDQYYNGKPISEEEREQYHDEDDARQQIQEDPLSIEVRSDWEVAGVDLTPGEYMILLCTGGPAVRITGQLNDFKEPDSAVIEFQDWFTAWEEYPANREQKEKMIAYAKEFYFGE